MKENTDILTIENIRLLVDSFYDKVRKDEVLSPVFNEVIKDNWEKHLEKMYRFWQTILLDEHTYFGSPFLPHAQLPVDKQHFEKWLALFHQTIDEHFEGIKAQEAKTRALKMAEMFQFKLERLKEQSQIKPIL